MHAEANGWYWASGARPGHYGERYHGGNTTPAEGSEACAAILARHLRVTEDEATALVARLSPDYYTAKGEFSTYVDSLRPRWAQEAADGLALIATLAAELDATRDATLAATLAATRDATEAATGPLPGPTP
jgi:hypothetical protein